MDWGLANRLSRIIQPDTGRTVMLAVDHGYFLGPTSGLEDPGKTVEPLLPYADTLMLTRGVLRTSVSPKSQIPIVLRVSGGTSILNPLSNEGLTVSMKEAIRLQLCLKQFKKQKPKILMFFFVILPVDYKQKPI